MCLVRCGNTRDRMAVFNSQMVRKSCLLGKKQTIFIFIYFLCFRPEKNNNILFIFPFRKITCLNNTGAEDAGISCVTRLSPKTSAEEGKGKEFQRKI